MAGEYEVWLTNDSGVRVLPLQNNLWFNASRVVNAMGFFNMGLPLSFNTQYIKPDYMVQIWRKPTGGIFSLWRPYFIRKWRYERSEDHEAVILSGPDCCDLLRRRIVAAFSGSSQAEKTDYADDMMKEIVSESISDAADPTPDAGTRVWSDFSVAPDVSAGPTLTKAMAWERLLYPNGSGVLADIAQAAREAGTEVFFDVMPAVTSSSISFEFRTYTGQPGMDVSGLGIVFDEKRGNLRDTSLEYDYTAEVNYVYAGGEGKGADRNIQQVYDSTRYGISQWARCEGFADARTQTTDDGVREAGRVALEEGRPVIRFGGRPMDTKGSRFGVHWDFGYKVRARFRGEEFDAIIRAVTISKEEDKEDIGTRLEYVG